MAAVLGLLQEALIRSGRAGRLAVEEIVCCRCPWVLLLSSVRLASEGRVLRRPKENKKVQRGRLRWLAGSREKEGQIRGKG